MSAVAPRFLPLDARGAVPALVQEEARPDPVDKADTAEEPGQGPVDTSSAHTDKAPADTQACK